MFVSWPSKWFSFLLVVTIFFSLQGCSGWPWGNRAPSDQGSVEGLDFSAAAQGVDGAIEKGLASPGGYVVIEDRTERKESTFYTPKAFHLSWPRRELRVRLSDAAPLEDYIAGIESRVLDVGGEVSHLEEERRDQVRVATLMVRLSVEVEGNEVILETHRLTLVQGEAEGGYKGRLAIVIDDFGDGVEGTREIMDLDLPLTFAILPFRSHTVSEAGKANEKGFEVILHLPMEPLNPQLSPGPGAITVDMTPEEIRGALQAALEQVPEARGVNNHMGSRATAREEIMYPLLEEVKSQGLFFLDSFTTANSVAEEVGGPLGVPLAVNRLFLDNQREVDMIKNQLQRAANLARKEGEIVAIGHVHPAMVQALAEFAPEFEKQGVKLVFLSQVVN